MVPDELGRPLVDDDSRATPQLGQQGLMRIRRPCYIV